MKILILGGGRVGSAIAYDLSDNHLVTVADISQYNLDQITLKCNVDTIIQDFSELNSLNKLLVNYELIVSAVPGFMGFEVLKNIIQNKKNVVDISFFPENALDLNKLAEENNVTALVDFGVAPGLGNIIFGHYDKKMVIDQYECYVGGLPKNRELPFEYKAPFSPIDVIEEYTRPARLFENSKIIIKKPLTEIETITFDNIGDLEAFNTDGLRSLLYTMSHVPNMKEKTLRYPGHASKIQLLKDMGLFSNKPIGENQTIPINLTSSLLKKQWFLKPNEEEFTVMKIILKNSKQLIEVDLYDEYDKKTNVTSMARTTGYTCTAGVNLLANNVFNEKGIYPPELIGQKIECYEYVIEYLKNRNINLKTKIK